MTTKAQKQLDELQLAADKITRDLAQLETEAANMDYTTDPAASVTRLEAIQAGIAGRKRALQSFKQKIDAAGKAVEAEKQTELTRQAAGRISDLDHATRRVVKDLQTLDEHLNELEAIRTDLKSMYKQGSPDVFGPELKKAVDYCLKQKLGFYPELLGLPAKPTTQEAWIKSAELALKNARARLADLKKKQGKPETHVHQADIDKAEQSVKDCENQLRRMKGENFDPAKEEREAAIAKRAAGNAQTQAEQVSMINQMKQRAAELGKAAGKKKP